MTWSAAKLCDVAKIERNGVDPTSIEPGTSYLGLEHIESGGRILGAQTVTNGELASTKFRFSSDHILYGKLRPYLAKIALPDFDGICSTDILPVKPGPKIDKRYLAYFLRQPSMVDYANGRSSGANLPRLSPKALEEFDIPLPPLDEQKRIAAILDQADTLRRLRQRAISVIAKTKTALFHQMFSQSADTKPLGSVIKVGSGNGLTAKDMRGGDVPVYGGNGINGWHDEGFVDAHTVIIGRVGVYCGAVHVTEKNAWVTDNALIVKKLIDIETDYLAEALKAANLNQYAGRSAQPLVSGSRLYPVEIPLPPIEDQRKFAAKTAEIASQKLALQKSLESIERLFDSLQHRAFRGEL